MPAQHRLSQNARSLLRQLAEKWVTTPAEDAARAAAYEKAAPMVRSTVLDKYPMRDMKICQKYDAAKVDDCIKLTLVNGVVQQFVFKKGTGPLVVKQTYQGQIYLADAPTSEAVEAWVDAAKAREAARTAKLRDYYALIAGSITFDQLTAVWPEAEQVKGSLGFNTLITLSPEVVERIKADVAAHKDGDKAIDDDEGTRETANEA